MMMYLFKRTMMKTEKQKLTPIQQLATEKENLEKDVSSYTDELMEAIYSLARRIVATDAENMEDICLKFDMALLYLECEGECLEDDEVCDTLFSTIDEIRAEIKKLKTTPMEAIREIVRLSTYVLYTLSEDMYEIMDDNDKKIFDEGCLYFDLLCSALGDIGRIKAYYLFKEMTMETCENDQQPTMTPIYKLTAEIGGNLMIANLKSLSEMALFITNGLINMQSLNMNDVYIKLAFAFCFVRNDAFPGDETPIEISDALENVAEAMKLLKTSPKEAAPRLFRLRYYFLYTVKRMAGFCDDSKLAYIDLLKSATDDMKLLIGK